MKANARQYGSDDIEGRMADECEAQSERNEREAKAKPKIVADGHDHAAATRKARAQNKRMRIDDRHADEIPPEEKNAVVFNEKRPSFLEMERLFDECIDAEIRFNVRTNQDEYRYRWAAMEWETVTDRVMNGWVKKTALECRRVVGQFKNESGRKVDIEKPDIRSRDGFEHDFNVWFSDEADAVDPFVVWLKQLPKWDGTPRLDTWMRDAGMNITNGNEEYVRWVSRYFFLAPVQRAFEPGCELQQIPVLWGPRGTGKSSAVEYTMPKKHRQGWYTDDFRLIADSKQMIEMTEGKVVMEWPELRGIARLDAEEIKSYISGKTDRARKAYAKRSEDVPRRGVLIGTTNDAALKADPALMRRIVVLHVAAGCDVGRLRDYMDDHRIQLFAEAQARYRRKERAHLDYELEDGLDLNNSGAVWRNWNVIETIEDAVKELTDEDGRVQFTKMEFCEAIGAFEQGSIRETKSEKELRAMRDKWWRDNGPRFTRTLRDLGFVESSKPRGFVLEDPARFHEITGSGAPFRGQKTAFPRPETPISAESQPNWGYSRVPVKNPTEDGRDHSYVSESGAEADILRTKGSEAAPGLQRGAENDPDNDEITIERIGQSAWSLEEDGLEPTAENVARLMMVDIDTLIQSKAWKRAVRKGMATT